MPNTMHGIMEGRAYEPKCLLLRSAHLKMSTEDQEQGYSMWAQCLLNVLGKPTLGLHWRVDVIGSNHGRLSIGGRMLPGQRLSSGEEEERLF